MHQLNNSTDNPHCTREDATGDSLFNVFSTEREEEHEMATSTGNNEIVFDQGTMSFFQWEQPLFIEYLRTWGLVGDWNASKPRKNRLKWTRRHRMFKNTIFENTRIKIQILAYYALHLFPLGWDQKYEIDILMKAFSCTISSSRLVWFKEKLRERVKYSFLNDWVSTSIVKGTRVQTVNIYYERWETRHKTRVSLLGISNGITGEMRLFWAKQDDEGDGAWCDFIRGKLITGDDSEGSLRERIRIVSKTLPCPVGERLGIFGFGFCSGCGGGGESPFETPRFKRHWLITKVIFQKRLRSELNKQGRNCDSCFAFDTAGEEWINGVVDYVQGWLCYYSLIGCNLIKEEERCFRRICEIFRKRD